jgi:hypothetical protein
MAEPSWWTGVTGRADLRVPRCQDGGAVRLGVLVTHTLHLKFPKSVIELFDRCWQIVARVAKRFEDYHGKPRTQTGPNTRHAQARTEEVRLALMETYPSIMIQAVRYYSTYEKNQYVLEFGDDMQVIAAKLALGGMEAGRGGTHWSRGVRGADDHDPGAGSPASLWQGTMHDDSGMETLFWLRWADADDARHAARTTAIAEISFLSVAGGRWGRGATKLAPPRSCIAPQRPPQPTLCRRSAGKSTH